MYACSGYCMGSSYWGAFWLGSLRKRIKAIRILLAGWIVAISLWIIDTFRDILCVISDWTYFQWEHGIFLHFFWFSIIFCEWMKFSRGYFILKLESNVWVSTSIKVTGIYFLPISMMYPIKLELWSLHKGLASQLFLFTPR